MQGYTFTLELPKKQIIIQVPELQIFVIAIKDCVAPF